MHDPLLGQQLDRYRLHALLGHGGMARVYQATDTHLGREVALKVVEPPRVGAADFITRFQREAQTLAQLQHPAIVTIYTVGQHGSLSYLVQELLPGPTFEAELLAAKQAGRPFDPGALVTLLAPIASALDYAHADGIIHRDLKPSNLMRNAHGTMVLMDFGIAKSTASADKLTKTGMVLGTPHYLAPEQAQGLALSPATDIYALGVLLFEALTGQVPFDDRSSLAIALAHVTQPPPSVLALRPDLPPAVAEVVATALAKAPEQRFASAGTLVQALQQAWQGTPAVIAAPTQTGPAVVQPAARALPVATTIHSDATTVNPALPARSAAPAVHQAATTVNPALHAQAQQARTAPPAPMPAASRAPAARPGALRRWGLVGVGLALAAVLIVPRLRTTPPTAAPDTAGNAPTAPAPTGSQGAATGIPATSVSVVDVATAVPPPAVLPTGDPFAQADALLTQAVAAGQATPAAAALISTRLAALEAKLASGSKKQLGKVRAEVTAAIRETERDGSLSAATAADLRVALGQLGLETSDEDDED